MIKEKQTNKRELVSAVSFHSLLLTLFGHLYLLHITDIQESKVVARLKIARIHQPDVRILVVSLVLNSQDPSHRQQHVPCLTTFQFSCSFFQKLTTKHQRGYLPPHESSSTVYSPQQMLWSICQLAKHSLRMSAKKKSICRSIADVEVFFFSIHSLLCHYRMRLLYFQNYLQPEYFLHPFR